MSIQLRGVSFTYLAGTPFEKTAIKDINLEIRQGEVIGIIGHTGSGKSTLVQHLNGLLEPTRGEVLIDGVKLDKSKEAKVARRKVGMVFQYPEQQLFEETVYDDIAFGPRNLGLAAEETDRRVKQAMEFVGLNFSVFSGRSPFRLSGGQMRRVAVAGVIALEPAYLVLDEPSAGLDPRGRDEIFNQIMDLHQAAGMAVVLVSHNMEDIARMADRLLVMHQGTVLIDGRPDQVFTERQAELIQAGVDVPNITTVLRRLRRAGLNVDDRIITPPEACEAILTALEGRRHAK
ncbi:energy-coupling factor transporter ATPase [Acetonema longum]|uniref:Energy-coupling factor transporter ATP-binding protein EcfA2 n=1 Tax=Acetonema longum DSM 6540 TaxID=1009370 RepID=F7NF65_9FIRM|nr:energy-coupling factor transporter ATPase [Acetonema longum]EGO65320.1 cobalt transporter ATP-binding subunit [Acetonema longum DSM 6540]